MKTAAVVLRLGHAGLAVARTLRRAGIPVFGLDWTPGNVGCVSRDCIFQICPPPSEPDRLLEYLIDLSRRLDDRPALMLSSDHVVVFASRYREELAKFYRLNVPEEPVARAMVDKFKQHELAASLGIPHPACFAIDKLDDLSAVQDRLEFPVIIKPVHSHEWRRHFLVKAIPVSNPKELFEHYRRIAPVRLKTVIQSFIPGPTSNLHIVCAYIAGDGRVPGFYTLHKLRQFPIDFGQAALAVTIDSPEVAALGLRFAQEAGFRGACMVEFKYDGRDGQWKLMELNPRYWTHTLLGPDCGVSLPMLHYLDLTNGVIDPPAGFRPGVRWLDFVKDVQAFRGHHKRGEWPFCQWIGSLRGVSSHASFAWNDPRPFFRDSKVLLSALRYKLASLASKALPRKSSVS